MRACLKIYSNSGWIDFVLMRSKRSSPLRLLSILFWIFAWNLLDLLIGELNLKNKQLIIFYLIALIFITIVIYFDKDFFNYA